MKILVEGRTWEIDDALARKHASLLVKVFDFVNGTLVFSPEKAKSCDNSLLNLVSHILNIPLPLQRRASITKDEVVQKVQKKVVVVKDAGDKVIFTLPEIDDQLMNIVRTRFSVEYFVPKGISVYERQIIRAVEIKRNILIAYPFLYPDLVKIFHSLGYDVKGTIQIPSKSIELKKGVELYSFQKNALKAWLANGKRGTIVIPTGGGKTFIAMKAIELLKLPSVIFVTTVELANQWKSRLEELGANVGIFGAGEHEIDDVTVAIYNSAVKNIEKLRNRFAFAIFDEAHHVPANTFKEVSFTLKSPFRMALSATPFREDKNEKILFFTCGKIVYFARYSEMLRERLVSPLEFYRVYVKMDLNEKTMYASIDEQNLTEKLKVAYTTKEKYKALEEIVRRERERKMLIFTQYIDQAETAYETIRHLIPSALLTGEVSTRNRRKIFERFKNGRIRAIISTTVLDEGVDVPDADVAIILSGSGSVRQLIQRIGRVIRYREGKIARVYEIITSKSIEESIVKKRGKALSVFGVNPKILSFK
ncbi:MAG: DEAD/DEAH box helicase [Candidatus Bathyarchaeia archaeon]